MVGIDLNARCPYCQSDNVQYLGFTKYFTVNDSKTEYMRMICEHCGQPFLVAHSYSTVTEVRKMTETDRLKHVHTICW